MIPYSKILRNSCQKTITHRYTFAQNVVKLPHIIRKEDAPAPTPPYVPPPVFAWYSQRRQPSKFGAHAHCDQRCTIQEPRRGNPSKIWPKHRPRSRCCAKELLVHQQREPCRLACRVRRKEWTKYGSQSETTSSWASDGRTRMENHTNPSIQPRGGGQRIRLNRCLPQCPHQRPHKCKHPHIP